MATPVILPRFNFDMEEGTINKWLREPGDTVAAGEPVCEVETGKVAMEVESPASGILAGIRASAGDTVPVTSVLAYIAADEEEARALAADDGAPGQPAEPEAASPVAVEQGSAVRQSSTAERGPDAPADDGAEPQGSAGRLRMTPAVRRLVEEHGFDPADLADASGRVTMDAVRNAVSIRTPAPPKAQGAPLSSVRRTIAGRMLRAHAAPHINLTAEVRFGPLLELRAGWKTERPGVVAMIAAATVRALQQRPLVNSIFTDDLLTTPSEVNLGLAIARPEGLIVPVLRDAHRLSVAELSGSLRDLVNRARDGGLRPEETRGGTFTVSSLGERGVDLFTALINPPQVGILAVGRIADRLVIRSRSHFSIEPAAYLTLSCDHRIVDGAPGADFLRAVKDAIEDPSWMVGS